MPLLTVTQDLHSRMLQFLKPKFHMKSQRFENVHSEASKIGKSLVPRPEMGGGGGEELHLEEIYPNLRESNCRDNNYRKINKDTDNQ